MDFTLLVSSDIKPQIFLYFESLHQHFFSDLSYIMIDDLLCYD